jgi:tetratricopeptide (TPR) repeat protein
MGTTETGSRPAPDSQHLLAGRAFPVPFRSVVFLALSYAYIVLRVDPAVIYDSYWVTGRFPLFQTGSAFLHGFLSYPGGLADYASAFLCQFYHWPWAGGLAITAVTALLCLAMWLYLTAAGGAPPRAVHLAPAVLVLMLFGQYDNALPTALSLLTAAAGAAAYVRLPLRSWPLRLSAFVILAGVVCWLGAGAVLMMSVLCGVYELAAGWRGLGAAFGALAMVSLLVAAVWVFRTDLTQAYERLLPPFAARKEAGLLLARCLYLLFPCAALVMAFGRGAGRRHGGPGTGVAAASVAGALGERAAACARILEPFALLALAALPVWLAYDDASAAALRVEHCARERAWESVLREARRVPAARYDAPVKWQVNRALYYTGRLGDSMFCYPQDALGLFPSGRALAWMKSYGVGCMKYSDIEIELGRVNEAEHMANEALELLGDRPAVLQRLALIHIVKGRREAARLFLRALGKDLVYADWARLQLDRLDSGPLMADDDEVAGIRSVMVLDDATGFPTLREMLEQLLERNPRNRMAFEYLMADYLLAGDLDGIVRNIGRLGDFGYPDIPRHYQEAVTLYRARTGKSPDLGRFSISGDTERRFDGFEAAVASFGHDRRAARDALSARYADTYFFYYDLAREGSGR